MGAGQGQGVGMELPSVCATAFLAFLSTAKLPPPPAREAGATYVATAAAVTAVTAVSPPAASPSTVSSRQAPWDLRHSSTTATPQPLPSPSYCTTAAPPSPAIATAVPAATGREVHAVCG